MVEKAGGYHVPHFKGLHEVTHDYPLSPTIFNVVMGAVINQWVTVMLEEEADPEGPSKLTQCLVVYFYADDGLIASTQVGRIQRNFNALMELFDRVVLRKNLQKMVRVV